MIKSESKTFYLARIAYDGSSFYGFVKQIHGKTVQEVIETKLSKVFQKPIKIYYCSRTDKGVHALDQAIALKLDSNINFISSLTSLNKILNDEGITINSIHKVKSLQLSKFVIKKTYRYKFYFGAWNLFLKNYQTWIETPLQKIKLAKILENFYGTHNFYNFSKKKDVDINESVRTIFEIKIINQTTNSLEIEFTGNGFLRYMIRKIVASAIDCYNNKISLTELVELINLKKLDPYPKLASPVGLYLVNIDFEKDLFI
ncbi:tRNA pseudouridine(38-40) synthase TruA [Mycoplasma sp. SG1]|uniref:tRNA pseudouridine(38-40) synthase TruA n=1 Tax=Mycoplasma sp. SG1 TaxID=2810348 RepID=UPI0020251409|nr:tRNA pseudouridine(38-40) synthase TruA [Mycoplasma sp. SG1]URM52921.1 tRNA pseudouridine(38-40) synthase TruA [Mycoplasma sp. SG1]